MKLVPRKDIDTSRWNQLVSESPVENVFLYSWYLDAVCSDWSLLVDDHFTTGLVIPHTKKLGVRQFIQAQFTREYDIIGNAFNWNDALLFLSQKFKSIHFRNSAAGILEHGKKRQHQWIDLKSEFQAGYSTNAKRILKKVSFELSVEKDVSILIRLFKENVAHKIDTLSKADIVSLEKLMSSAMQSNQGELLLVKENDSTVAAGFFLLDKKRVTYLKGAATEPAKKGGAMYFLIDAALKRYRDQYATFDFGGSEIKEVAAFYHKFGAQDRTYFDYQVNDLPLWFKTLKKWKR